MPNGKYVLAANYDRDTQALQSEVDRLKGHMANLCTVRDELHRRVEEPEAHLGAHHKMPCATCDVKQAAIAQLTARLAACQEALERHGKHRATCASVQKPEQFDHECCCGLDKALAHD